jgi:hypothetical protein
MGEPKISAIVPAMTKAIIVVTATVCAGAAFGQFPGVGLRPLTRPFRSPMQDQVKRTLYGSLRTLRQAVASRLKRPDYFCPISIESDR